jgi:hypothetical protein
MTIYIYIYIYIYTHTHIHTYINIARERTRLYLVGLSKGTMGGGRGKIMLENETY